MPRDDFDLLCDKLMEGQQYLDLMYLPSDAIAWLFDQPENQVQTAMELGRISHEVDNQVVSATLLKDDQLIVILELASGRKIRIYPDGGLSSDGRPYDVGELSTLMADDIPGVEMGMGGMERDPMGRGVTPDAASPVDPMEPVGADPLAPDMPPEGGALPPDMPPEGATGSVVVAPPMGEPPIEPSPDEGLGMEDDLLGGMGVKPLSDLM